MKLQLQGKFLSGIESLLFDLKLKKVKQTRARTKLRKLVERKLKEYNEDRKEIFDKYAIKDRDGKPKIDEEGRYSFPLDVSELNEELTTLGDEVVIIEGGEYVNHIDIMKEVLENTEMDLSGIQAEAFDHLLDAYETAESKNR